MHYVYWLHRHKFRRKRLGYAWRSIGYMKKENLLGVRPKFRDLIGVVVGLDPRTLQELKCKARVQDNEQAILKAIKHYLRCQYDIDEEDR